MRADGTQLPDQDLSTVPVSAGLESERLIIEGEAVNPVEYPALPEVAGTRINSGKKTSYIRPEEFPSIANNDYRELLATTPGLLVSEEPSSPIVNFGYRGLDSQRSEFMQILKDGVSIKNEQFGFPEAHYTPILDAVERVEFIRAGAALQFGPQPGGALNFVMKTPPRDVPFTFMTKNLFGTDGLYQNFTSAGGTVGNFGYYAYYDHRQRDGFRTNSDYDLDAGSAKLSYDLDQESRLTLTLDAYDEEHGEPGGLTEVPAPGASLYQLDRNASTRLFDRFRLRRYYGMIEYQKIFSERTQLDIKAFGGYLQRFSKRQRGGGFGVAPDPNPAPGSAASTNDVQDREDYTEGAEVRFRHDYDFAHDVSTFAGGLYFYHALQDRHDERGATPDAESGLLRRFNTGETTDFALFAENRFHFGKFSVTPGMRLEFFEQSLDEKVNITRAPGDPLLSSSDFSFVPLFSLGANYVLLEGQVPGPVSMVKEDSKTVREAASLVPGGPPRMEIYATVAQAYRPRTYGELVPTAPDGVVNGDLKEGESLQFELGVRGKPLPYLTFDLGGFYFEVTDQVGEITGTNAAGSTFTTTQNVGDARYAGFEAAFELDLLSIYNGGTESPYGRFNLYGNVTLLDAEFISGPNKGFDTTYAPDYQFKVGGIYRWKETVKVGLLGNLVDDSFADANNTPSHFIPAHTVWDLTAEVKFLDGRLGVFAGIRNLFDEDFYAEIRDEGIVPAYRRNYYGGFSVKF
ncbi:MAG: TonB-dependent receptor plug domain-containing protein [Verrucomicrobiota bacterium]|nr:TonB-dependent receptor plug domain-containing protein [Verrucomicrobiota bacterium]